MNRIEVYITFWGSLILFHIAHYNHDTINTAIGFVGVILTTIVLMFI